MSGLDASSRLHIIQRRLHNSQFALKNHLLSIEHDARSVELLSSLYPNLPLIANLRNGLWYTERKHCSCYFKSTDGHVHKWEFSSKRLNMNVALAACASEGCIIVDSTRRGKRFPDSMSYTIPIWCAVLNHIVLGLGVHESLHLPPWIPTGLSEAVLLSLEAILVQLHGDVRGLLLSTLSGSLTRPLRPIWCSVEEGMIEWFGKYSEEFVDALSGTAFSHIPVVLFSCSEDIAEGAHREEHSWHYIKGAGDDEENWSNGLTPELFWKHKVALLCEDNSDSDVINLVDELVSRYDQDDLVARDPVVDAAYLLASAPMIIADTCIILYPQEYWRSQCCDFDALDGIIEISKTQEYSYRKGGSVKFCHISYKSATQKQKKVHNEYAHIFARALSFYHHLMFSAVESPPKMAILCSHDMSSAFLITFAILIAFFSKPTRPSCDRLAPAGVDDNPFSCSFQPLLRTWRYTRDLSKHDIKFVYSMVQINCPTCLHIPRVLLQELTKFFLSPDPVKLKERILCNSAGSVISLDTDSNGNQHHASGRDKTISSCWDNLIFELCNLNLEI